MSREVFLLPDVGEGLVEAEIVAWKVAVGDVVALNQPLVDVETAKATVELPSPFSGTVVELHHAVGDVVEVHKPLVSIETDASAPAPAAAAPAEAAPAAEPIEKTREAVLVGYGVGDEGAPTRTRRRRGAPAPVAPTPVASAPAAPVASEGPALAPRSTPPVRLYAKSHGIDLSTVRGTGRDGLITRADVEALLAGGVAGGVARAPVAPTTTTRFVGHDLAPWASGPAEERIPVRGVLRSMAEAMTQSARSAPHAAVWVRLDATRTMELVAALKQRPAFSGVRLSPLAIVAMAVCDAARHYPGVNSSFDAEKGEVVVRRVVNLGIAADTPRGLIVPNVKAADRLDLVAMAQALNTLVDTARAGTTAPNDMLGTTITITNVGPFNVDAAVPILPPGTGAIVAFGRVAPAPWVVDGEVAVRQVTELAMSFDHRQVDGALASRVLRHVADYLEDPGPRLIAG